MSQIVAKLEAGTNRIASVNHTTDAQAAALLAQGWVELTPAQFAAFRAGGRNVALIDGVITTLAAPETPLQIAIENALDQIDRAAEAARLRFITKGAGQALEYQATLLDAQAFIAGGSVGTDAQHPWLAAEVSAGDVTTLAAAATSVISNQSAWIIAGAAIKATRRRAKVAVLAAPTAAAVRAIVAGLRWPTAAGGVDPDPGAPLEPPPFDYAAAAAALSPPALSETPS